VSLKQNLEILNPTVPLPPRLKRTFDPLAMALSIASPVAAILLALLVIAIPILLTGKDPLYVYGQMYQAAWGDSYGQSETIVKAIPLTLCGLGVAIAFKARLWNIGAEGQFYAGVLGATALALAFPDWPAALIIPAMVLAGLLGGALWALLPALLRGLLDVNEIITSLMLNYVAIFLVNYFIYGPWKDPKGFNFPKTAPFSEASALPILVENTRIHSGLILALVSMTAVWLLLGKSAWGFELKVQGESANAARYAGMKVTRNIIIAFLLSGALAGLAGMSEVTGIGHRLEPNLSPGYGYTAIIVAWLARLNPWAVGLVAILFGGLLSSGFTMQRLGISSGLVTLLQGAILFFVLASEALSRRLLYTRALTRGQAKED
jgi:simple sugar transport system permease protein